MSTISSNSLFHFTKSLKNLEDILKNGLKFHCFSEKIPGSKLTYLVEGLCFCDIPLSQIKEHLLWYGDYGIGVKQSFLKNLPGGFHCSPVVYAHRATPFLFKGNSLAAKKAYEESQMTGFLKRYKGKQIPNGKTKPRIKCFYDEKEWRIIKDKPYLYQVSNFSESKELKDFHESSISPSYIIIPPSMIEYIIFPGSDYSTFFTWLKGAFKANYIDYLPKILTTKQILNDF